MKSNIPCLWGLILGVAGCSSDSESTGNPAFGTGGAVGTGGSSSNTGGSTGNGGAPSTTGGATNGGGGTASGTGGVRTGTGGATTGADASTGTAYDDIKALIDRYKAAHPGNGGKDWDINALTPAQVAADPDAQKLLSLCGPDQRPVIPELAWEYGGTDHQWINPQASPLVICVYVAVNPSTAHFQYDAAKDHITADVYVLYPAENPCNNQQGAQQVLGCVGDPTNLEILVDTSSYHDGADVGLALANSSTDLYLILGDGSKVLLYQNV